MLNVTGTIQQYMDASSSNESPTNIKPKLGSFIDQASSEYLNISPNRIKDLDLKLNQKKDSAASCNKNDDINILREILDRSIIKELDEHDQEIVKVGYAMPPSRETTNS